MREDSGLMIRLLVALFLAVTMFSASFYVTDSVLAHGTHCGVPPNPPCGHHYAGQVRSYSNGMSGHVRTQDVALLDRNNDTVFQWVGSTDITGAGEWNQIGFAEGLMPNGFSWASPIVYEEYNRTYCDPAYEYIEHDLVSGYHERFWTYWGGTGGGCPSNPSRWVYIWWLKRGTWDNAPFDFNYDAAAAMRYDAETEHLNFTHMEPNGTVCFGTNSSCAAAFVTALGFYTQSRDTWSAWTALPDGVQNDWGYSRTVLQNYWAFKTTGW